MLFSRMVVDAASREGHLFCFDDSNSVTIFRPILALYDKHMILLHGGGSRSPPPLSPPAGYSALFHDGELLLCRFDGPKTDAAWSWSSVVHVAYHLHGRVSDDAWAPLVLAHDILLHTRQKKLVVTLVFHPGSATTTEEMERVGERLRHVEHNMVLSGSVVLRTTAWSAERHLPPIEGSALHDSPAAIVHMIETGTHDTHGDLLCD